MPLASAARRPPEPEGIDFTVSSSLPPMVAGGVAGEMELSVPHLYPKPGVLCPTRYLRDRQREPLFLVRVQWWGDRGPGTVFKPRILRGRDEDGEVARRTRLSKATCALFPVRCRLDGLLTYLKDMGSIALDVLVYEGDPVGARHVGRCVVPVGGWGGQLDVHPGSRESGVVADGYFPVLSLDGNRYAGDLGVCLRACLGGSSKLRNVVAVAKLAADRTGLGEERREIMEALGYGTLLLSDVERGDSGIMGAGRGDEDLLESGRRKGSGVRPAGEMYNGLPTRASFDSADLADGSSGGSPATVAVASSTARLPRGSAPMSSFQLNEALAKFDASDTLPMWPTPKGSLYHPPETYGEAPPRTHTSQRQVRGRPAAGIKADPGRKSSPISRKAPSGVSRGPPTRVGAVLTGNTRISGIIAGEPPERSSGGRADPKEFGSSVSPERQAPDPSRPDANRAISFSGGDDRGRADAEAPTSPRRATASPRQPRGRGGAATSASEPSRDGRYLSELLNRGKDLRDKMILAAGPNDAAAAAAAAPPPSTTNASLPIDAAVDLAGLIARPGFVSGAQLGSSLRDDIEGIFDTLSDGDPPLDDEAGVLVRDPETRGSESRVVDLLLAAAGPPPSSLAFPALAAVERRRADSLARVRFLRIRLSRLVMFGSMASAPEGHGWQLRFRLPAFATPPGRSGAAARSRSRGASAAGAGSARNARVVSVPVPPRVPAVTLGKSKAAVRRGRSASGTAARTAASVLRVRRGFGACDLVVGETSLLEEMVCAVDVDDACVSQWMDTALEFLLVDGKTDGAPRPRPAGHLANHPHLKQQQQQPKASSTVGPGDRVAAVATLRMRDLILSADLGVATTLDLVEVSDFWAAEDARAASSGRVGRRGRPLRNPYRSEVSGGGARPLVLGDRAVGALAVALELVPGEQDVSPEHSRPEVERWSQGPRQRGAAAGQVETQARVSGWGEPTAEDGGDGASRTDVDLAPPPPRPPAEAAGARILPGGRGGDPPDNGDAEASEVRSSVASNLEDPAESATSKEGEERESGTKPVTSPSPAARSPPSLGGSWKEGSGAAATPALDVDCAVVLRIDELSLVPAAGSGVEQVRVAYSFTQVEGSTPTVTHRSVRGHRAPPSARGSVGGGQQEHSSPFSFRHQEVFPAPADGGTWRLEAGTSRVFEVWGCASEGSEGGGGDGGGAGHPEALLGLAKVSLRPFAAFECAAGRGGGQRGGAAAEGSRLAVGADGPVAVVDPFSGRTVGELRLFLALGSSETIAALSDPRAGNCDAGAAAAEEEVGATGSAVDGVGEAGEEGGKGGAEQEGEWRIERQTKREETVHGDGDGDGVMDAVLAEEEPPALDDSVAELSMLLNPSWAKSPKPEAARSNSGFAGLVRHVIELSAVGELPLALDDASAGKEDVDGPVGCAIEYMLPSVQASPSLHLEADDGGTPPGAGQIHELWWDADSGILNSRSRHTIKVPGGMLDNLPAGPTHGGDSGGESEAAEDRPLHNLLDCMLGREDVVLSLYWSTGGAAGARQPAPWSRGDGAHEHEEANAALAPAVAREQRRSPLGTVVLRRADLLPLVRRTSARAVLRLPIEPAVAADEGGRAPALPPLPGTLPLSISYRREPSAVARRKSRGWSLGKAAGGGESDGGGGGQEESLDASCDADSTLSHADALEHPPNAGLGEGGEKSMGGEGPANGEHGTGRGESPSAIMPSKGSGVEGGSGGVDSPAFRGSCGQALVHPSSKTQHLLPARTKLCVFVASVSLGEDFVDVGERVADGEEKDLLLWVSFEFPGAKRSGQPERRRGGVFVWKPGDENAKRREVHWSPAASASRESGSDFVAPLQWTIELPVTIDAAFVEFVRTQSLELCVWKGGRASWPSSGTACGVGKLLLRPLLTTLEGVGGDVVVAAEVDGGGGGGDRAGSVAARVSFKHRGLGSNGDASAETSESQAGTCSNGGDGGPAPGAAPAPGPGETSGRARRRVPVTFREEVEVFDQEEAGHRVDCDPAKRRGCAEMPPTGSGQPALGESSESPEPEGAGGEELSQESNSQQRQPGGTAPSPSSGGERGLEVCVEKAMRLVVASAAATALPPEDPEVAGCVVSPGTVLPSTYVTFRWEEEGKPPLRSPLVLRPLSSTSSRPAGEGGREGDWQDTSEEEVVTPVVEMSSNPVFNHVSKLRLVDPNSWGRVCGPSAALVFRVWRRPRRSWWDTPPQAASVAPAAEEEEEQQQPKPSPDGVVAAAAGSRFGDKLIGSAVVGLEILRGAIAARDVLCLREIDGWYHVLDDLQRPQGQLKVRVRPHPPSRVSGQGATSSLGAAPGQGQDQPLLPASLGSSSAPESIEICDDRKTDDGAKDIPPTPPLHDTQAHLRSVHALLDSLPAEFRSTQPRPPLRPPPPPAEIPPAARVDPLLELPAPSEEPGPSATLSGMAALPPSLPLPHQRLPGSSALGFGRHGCEPPSMPELRRMLSSLDRVDRRLFALGDGRDVEEDESRGGGDEETVGDDCTGADNAGRGRAGRELGGDEPVANCDPTKNYPSLEAARPAAVAEGAEAGQDAAISRLQQAWRARSTRKRRSAEAETEREAHALRQERRERAATVIQSAHRRAQARYRARAAAEERRRRELRQQRRAAACAVLERAWRAFEGRRRAARELAEARGRAVAAIAAAAAARRAEETARGAVLVQAVWRGMSARAAVARRFEASRARSLAAAPAADVPPAEQEASTRQAPSSSAQRLATGIAPAPQPQPSTFYNQLSQDPRRHRPLPAAHMAAAPSPERFPPAPARSFAASHSAAFGRDGKHGGELRAGVQQSALLGPRPLARSFGATKPPRFADKETARIARIMNGNLQHWATSARSSSSSDDVDT